MTFARLPELKEVEPTSIEEKNGDQITSVSSDSCDTVQEMVSWMEMVDGMMVADFSYLLGGGGFFFKEP